MNQSPGFYGRRTYDRGRHEVTDTNQELSGDPMIDLMMEPEFDPWDPPLSFVILSDDEMAALLRLLRPTGGYREHMVVTTQATLAAAGVTEETAREALTQEQYHGDPDYTQHIDLALSPEHSFFDFVDNHTNPKWRAR